VQSISDLIKLPGLVNLDFADVTAVMKDAGYAHMGVGRASGKDKAEQAANMAISSPLLETSINGAKGVIINITSSPDIGLDEIETASEMISKQAHEDANIIWGAAFDENMDDEMSVTVIATGFATHDGTPVSPAAEETASSQNKPQEAHRAAAQQSAGSASAASAEDRSKASAIDDDDTFIDIMSIFNRK
jgi:cell division protein FtsZ